MKKLFTFFIILTLLIASLSIAVYADSDGEIAGDTGAPSENFYSLVYSAIGENSEKIMSALAAICSLLLAFTYKKGLIPTLKSAIEKLKDAVGKIKEQSEIQSENAELILKTAAEKLTDAKSVIDSISERLSTLEENLAEGLEAKDEKEKFKTILLAQTEMLYEIFMTSSLPQYQKDIVGEKTAKMREQISDGK